MIIANFRPTTNIPSKILGALAYRFTFFDTLQQPNPFDPNGTALRAFITLLIKDTVPSLDIVIACSVYFRRIHVENPAWVANIQPCLLFTCCLSLAFKFVQDSPHSALLWTAASGFDALTLNRVERLALKFLQYELYISSNHLAIWQRHAKGCAQKVTEKLHQAYRTRSVVQNHGRVQSRGTNYVTSNHYRSYPVYIYQDYQPIQPRPVYYYRPTPIPLIKPPVYDSFSNIIRHAHV